MPARFLVAPDSFKGTYDAAAVADAIAAGIEAGGAERTLTVHDPLRRPVEASFGLLDDGRTAIVEMARASGLPLVAPEERDAERADTYGTGELIAAALAAGAEKVLVAVGGSATSDGGRGALEALREDGWPDAGAIEVLCDVDTPYEESARVFGPQKRATPAAVERLTARLHELAAALPRDPRGVPMTGCAGGLSGGLWACGGSLRPGAAYVLEAIGFDRRLAAADAVVGGEGRVDSQSFEGKIVGILADRCVAAGKPLHLVVGRDSLAGEAPAAVTSIDEAGDPPAMRRAGERLAVSSPA